jgi:hypothetical protein
MLIERELNAALLVAGSAAVLTATKYTISGAFHS